MEMVICLKSKKRDAAIHRIIRVLMTTVMMKMPDLIGVNANRQAITWLVSTEVVATNLIAWRR